jgi:hypothetical protein
VKAVRSSPGTQMPPTGEFDAVPLLKELVLHMAHGSD